MSRRLPPGSRYRGSSAPRQSRDGPRQPRTCNCPCRSRSSTERQLFYVTTPFESELTLKMDAVARTGDIQSLPTLLSALQDVAVRLSSELGSFYSPHDCAVKLTLLRHRFQLFSKYLKLPGVAYHSRKNEVFVSENYWSSLGQTPEGNMYAQFRQYGEPMYVPLHNIFVTARCARLPRTQQYLFPPSTYEPQQVTAPTHPNNTIEANTPVIVAAATTA